MKLILVITFDSVINSPSSRANFDLLRDLADNYNDDLLNEGSESRDNNYSLDYNLENFCNDEDFLTNFAISTNYILDTELSNFVLSKSQVSLNILHANCRSLNKNFSELSNLLSFSNSSLSAICLTETWLNKVNEDIFQLEGYNFVSKCRDKKGGGVGIFLQHNLEFSVCNDLTYIDKSIECLFIEIVQKSQSNILLGVIYRPPNGDLKLFNTEILKLLNIIDNRKFSITCIAGDYNVDLLKCDTHEQYSLFFNNLLAYSFIPCINKPTRVTKNSATLIDNIFIKTKITNCKSVIVYNDISDHFPIVAQIDVVVKWYAPPHSRKKTLFF